MQRKPEYRPTLTEQVIAICDMIISECTCRGCGSPKDECECTYDPRVELYDDPARGTR